MPKTRKTDNHDPRAKLALRRHFLRAFHAARPPRVIDCCQGSGILWGQLQKEFTLASYWGLDVKPKKGRLKLNSARLLAQPGWQADVVDVDTYGCPWDHFCALLPNVAGPITIFLTAGRVIVRGGSAASRHEIEASGANFRRLPLPKSFGPTIAAAALPRLLLAPLHHGLRIVEALEAPSTGTARYFGLRLERA
jgi:hypothetical protein